jgi:hypothetical protein
MKTDDLIENDTMRLLMSYATMANRRRLTLQSENNIYIEVNELHDKNDGRVIIWILDYSGHIDVTTETKALEIINRFTVGKI